MSVRIQLTLSVCLLVAALVQAEPPEPPEGYRWVINEAFSDEFDGDTLDSSKWHDHNPRWEGRPPGKFMPSSVSVGGGELRISSTKLDEPLGKNGQYTIACGAIQSKSSEAHYGYYECRMKASSSRTSSTFWLTSRTRKSSRWGELGLEIDIIEAVGEATKWKSFATHTHFNTHQNLKPNEAGKRMLRRRLRENPLTEKEKEQLAAIKNKAERSKKRKAFFHRREVIAKGGISPLDSRVNDDFHTYACWWVDANTLHFYADGKKVGTVEPPTDFDPEPFSHPLMMNLVCETYDWQGLPTEEQLTNPELNTTRYDYVRSYTLEKIE